MKLRQDYIYQLVEQHKYITPSLVARMPMFQFPSGRNKVQQIMGRMAADGLVSRFRVGRSEYVYHQGRRSAKWRHWLDLNRFHFAIIGALKSWQEILYWDFEVRYPFGQADAFYQIKTTIQGDGIMFFVEMDDGGNKFDKIQKYLAYWRGKTWRGEWWSKGVFPLVVIITPRAKEISGLVKKCCKADEQEIFRVLEKCNYSVDIILKGGKAHG